MPAITVTDGHVARALDFFERDDLFISIGRTTAWPDENNPPAPDPDADSVEEVIGYKKLEQVNLVVPDITGTISFRDTTWRIVSASNATTENARWVYLEAVIRYDELPLDDFRQTGLKSRLVRASGVSSSKNNLLPSEVSDPGILEVLDNHEVIHRATSQQEEFRWVIEF